MFDLKPITTEFIPRALSKAERYRYLNEPREAESICRDILRADDDQQEALTILVLALTDQFGAKQKVSVNHAQELLPRLADPFARAYYDGVIHERWAKAQLRQDAPGFIVYEWLARAMACYERAQELAPQGNEDAVLRWNTCARMIRRDDQLRPREEDAHVEAEVHDEVPHR